MHEHSRRIRILAAVGVVAVSVLATGSPANTQTPTSAKTRPATRAATLVSQLSDRDGGETYVWMVNGVQRGMAFR